MDYKVEQAKLADVMRKVSQKLQADKDLEAGKSIFGNFSDIDLDSPSFFENIINEAKSKKPDYGNK